MANDIEIVEQSRLFSEIAAGRSDIEIWPLDSLGEPETYFSIVARNEGAAKVIAYLRVKSGQLEKRTYDKNGDDLWIPAQ
jgi:hypothetical protein